MKKYELTDETIDVDGKTLHRIKALIDIPLYDVKAGDLGGFVQSEHNLRHIGTCWVGGSACVSDSARVSDSAHVSGSARVSGSAWVSGLSIVSDSAIITKTPIVINSGFYQVVICDNVIRIGCEEFTLSGLEERSMDSYPKWEEYKPWVIQGFKLHNGIKD